MVISIGCLLDGGRSECEFVVNCKKMAGLSEPNDWKKSSIQHQKEVSEDQLKYFDL